METTKYISKHTGKEIDDLLDKVKEDLVEPATLTKQVEKNTAELDKKVSKAPGKDLSSNDYTDNDKAEVAKIATMVSKDVDEHKDITIHFECREDGLYIVGTDL